MAAERRPRARRIRRARKPSIPQARASGRAGAAVADLVPPDGLVAERFELGGDEFVLFEWPTPRELDRTCLSQAESAVLDLVLAGHTNAEIAIRRGTSPRTVANQVAALFVKLGAGSRSELFAMAAGGRTPRTR
jgi:DNA-binding CsgD family transcriptional regulator